MGDLAVRYKIIERRKFHDFAVSSLADFTVEVGKPFTPSQILSNPQVSLYALDLEQGLACFVELPPNVELETKPFFYLAQFAEATHLITIPLDAFNALAESVDVDDNQLVFVHSVGRCGSTLVSRVFESLPSVRSLSEPDACTNLTAWRGLSSTPDDEIKRLLTSCTLFCCKTLTGSVAPQTFAIKFRSQCIEIEDLLAATFPAAKRIYLTRDPLPRLESMYRAFIDPAEIEKPEYRQSMQDAFAPLHPLTRHEVVEGQPMPVWKLILLDWIANSECFRNVRSQGITFFEMDYSELKNNGLDAVQRILEYCELPTPELSTIEKCLARDSQLGTGIDQAIVNDPSRDLPKSIKDKAIGLLSRYGYSADR